MNEKKYILSSLNNALQLIDFLADYGPLPLVEISAKLEFGKSSIYRMLSTLEQAGYVEKTKNLEYRLSTKFISLSSKVLEQRNDNEIILDYLIKIKDKFNESTHHGIINSNCEVLIVNKVSGDRSIRMASEIGGTLPTYASSLGKCIMANNLNEENMKNLKKLEFKKLTENTITNYDDLIKELEKIKKLGYSIDNEEAEDGLTCISVPIFDYTNKNNSAISISGPTSRLLKNKDEIIKFMIETGHELSKDLGYNFY